MTRTNLNLILGTLTAVFLARSIVALQAQAPAPANTTFKRTVLQQADLSAPGREVVQALAEIQPAGASGRHTHPGEEIAYVLAGPVVLEIDGKPAKTLQTGDVFLIPAGAIHNAKNTGKGVAKVVATYVIEKGKPVATPVQ